MCTVFCHIPICLFLFIVSVTYSAGVQREIKVQVNPACDISPECKLPNGSFLNIIHVKAVGPNDTIHYIWSTYDTPSVIVAQTSLDSSLLIDWEKLVKFQPGGLWFTETPKQSIALILTRVWQYDDQDDSVSLPESENSTISVNLTNFYWNAAKVDSNTPIVTASILASGGDPIFSNNGTLEFQFSTSGSFESSKHHPHLLFNSNSTQMRLILSNLHTINEKYRFAAEFMAISSIMRNDSDSWYHDVSNSIDDEYSPGVFKTHHIYSPYEHSETEKSFLTWKPVAYIGEKPTVSNSSDARVSKLSDSVDIPSFILLFYNSTNVTKVSWNMTFGTSGDGWYEHTNYTSWSIMIGLGDPGMENLSLLAEIVIGIGLGAPCAIILGGSLFLVYKKCRKDDDDELLLAG